MARDSRKSGKERAQQFSILVLGAIFFVGSRALAQEASPPPPAPLALETTPAAAPDSVDEDLTEAQARPAGVFKYGPVSLVDPLWKKFNKAIEPIGLKVGLAYTVAYQAASNGPGQRDAAGGDFDLFGDWRLVGEKDGLNNGYLYFAAEYRHDIATGIAPGALGGQIGSLWGTTNGFSEQPFLEKELYWQQHFGGDQLIVRAGKLDAENYYNSNYWQSDSKYFMNQAFSSFPVRAFPGNGLGANVTAKITQQWYVSTGFQDAEGVKSEAGFDTFFKDFNLFSAVEAGFTPNIEGKGRGTYRLTAWYRDAGDSNGKPHDAGLDFSGEQRISPHLMPFFRAGTGEGNINGIEHMISTGIGWEGAMITKSDVAGVGVAWGRPSDHSLDDQFAAEVFYRLQVSPDNQFTVGYQVIVDPVNDPGSDLVGVFEVRWRVAM
jgi:hypothetical protein